MADSEALIPARTLVAANSAHLPNESPAWRTARNALLVEEVELRRHIERVAALRRALPPGGAVGRNFAFEGEHGPVTLEGLFGDKDTLIIYSYMFGPKRKAPCPMCTSFMGSWEEKFPDIEQRAAFAMVARSPIDRLVAAKQARGWTRMKIYSDGSGDYTRAYVSADDADMPGYNVFTRRGGTIRHFWSGEISGAMADPGQDPRGAPDLDPLWTLLDTTPEGRGTDWYPKLTYPEAELVNMSKVRVGGFTVSIDGFGAGPEQSLEDPLGKRGTELHRWFVGTRSFRAMIGQEGGSEGVDEAFAHRSMDGFGAFILGRNMFGPIRGPWPDGEWKGWWGDVPPYHAPTFILTHHARDPIEMEGGTVFHFVTEGIEAALDQAKAAAGHLDVKIGGGVETVRQYLRAGLIDEMHYAISPVVLGRGEAMFADLDLPALGFSVTEQATTEHALHVVLTKA